LIKPCQVNQGGHAVTRAVLHWWRRGRAEGVKSIGSRQAGITIRDVAVQAKEDMMHDGSGTGCGI